MPLKLHLFSRVQNSALKYFDLNAVKNPSLGRAGYARMRGILKFVVTWFKMYVRDLFCFKKFSNKLIQEVLFLEFPVPLSAN